jgi:hypothetical protein
MALQFSIVVVEREPEKLMGQTERMAMLEFSNGDGSMATRIMLDGPSIGVLVEQLTEARKAVDSKLVVAPGSLS